MQFDSIKDVGNYLKHNYNLDSYLGYFLESDKQGTGFICPQCGHGSRNSKRGLEKIPNSDLYKCFNCGLSADIFKLLEIKESLNFTEAVKKIADSVNFEFSINHFDYKPIPKTEKQEIKADDTQPKKDEVKEVEDEAQKAKHRERIIKSQANFSEDCEAMQYLQSRGFSFSTCKNYGIGFDTYYKSVIIPTSEHSYIYRSIYSKNRGNSKDVKQHFFNEELFYKVIAKDVLGFDLKNYLFICEGWADSLSFLENECQSMAINSTTNKDKFLEIVKRDKNSFNKDFCFLLALDNDKAGKEATAEIMEKLNSKEFNFIKCFDVTSYLLAYGGNNYKDVNEAYVDNKEEFFKRVKKIHNANSIEEIEKVLYIGKSSIDDLMGLNKSYEITTEPIKTGFKNLDSALYQGFRAGLYILGAVSSLGKTSFMLQIASNIAEAGKDVLIFSLEMSAKELLAKILSRITFEINKDYSLNTAEILYNSFSALKRDEGEYVRNKAFERLQGFAEHIFISEGIGNITTDEIRNQILEHKRITGNVPFVVIDYVQIICPLDYKMTDKQATDRNITELKRISRDFDCVVFGISSFNRESYKEEVSMASFKESGAIEYGSDVLMGLQYAETERKEVYNPKTKSNELESDTAYKARRTIELKAMEEKAKNGEFIPLQVKILKNRNGSKNKVDIYYKPKNNYFTENKFEAD